MKNRTFFLGLLAICILYWTLLYIVNQVLIPSRVLQLGGKLTEKNAFGILFSNILVSILLASGIYTYGLSTLLVSVTNSVIFFSYVLPYISLYSFIDKGVWIVFFSELTAYCLMTAVGFSSVMNKIFRRKTHLEMELMFTSVLALMLLIIGAFVESSLLKSINSYIRIL